MVIVRREKGKWAGLTIFGEKLCSENFSNIGPG
jgi:hypothetical protein